MNKVGSTSFFGKSKKEHNGNELLFTCHPFRWNPCVSLKRDTRNTGTKVQGRLPKWCVEFLLPLIKFDYIVVQGSVGYDIGTVSVFDATPVNLYIIVNSDFCNMTATLNSSTAYALMKTRLKTDILPHGISAEHLVESRSANKPLILECCSSLLLWLTKVCTYSMLCFD